MRSEVSARPHHTHACAETKECNINVEPNAAGGARAGDELTSQVSGAAIGAAPAQSRAISLLNINLARGVRRAMRNAREQLYCHEGPRCARTCGNRAPIARDRAAPPAARRPPQ
ncbi:hypothetical protein EVAR_36161_1 [Eumeta japonica]|uniref:Uncharacterized protein n=1 Tax=Eumeta variegata TaxID=151549 RepID=A0A4C1X558_EUMVA|nr:hypothetical protein EVAR_36161_1 [Eumeta japonica]